MRLRFLRILKVHDPPDKSGQRFFDRREFEGAEPGDQVGTLGRGNLGWNWLMVHDGDGHRGMSRLDHGQPGHGS